MATCFVIQPFDAGKYDKRFTDIYKPAIEAAGLEAYRVDRDPRVQVPIESVEKGIRQAAICLAEISTDNPNVWYELGFAYAAGRPVVMVCSPERTKYPFDVQHRSIIPYLADSPSDFDKLKASLTEKINALIEQGSGLEEIAEAAPTSTIEGLSQIEVMVLAIVAGEIGDPSAVSVMSLAENAGVTSVGFNLAVRKLVKKSFVLLYQAESDDGRYSHDALRVDDKGWDWIMENEDRFVLLKQVEQKRLRGGYPPVAARKPDTGFNSMDDDIPF